MNYILVNKLANNEHASETVSGAIEKLSKRFGNVEEVSLNEIDRVNFYKTLKEGDNIVLVGGDGTINFFVNEIKDLMLMSMLLEQVTISLKMSKKTLIAMVCYT